MGQTIDNQVTTLKVPNYQNTAKTQSTESSLRPGSGPGVNNAKDDTAGLPVAERMASVASARENFDAVQSRLETITSNLQAGAGERSAAGERIRDADQAIETAMLTGARMMQQSDTAVSVQANVSRQRVLQLFS